MRLPRSHQRFVLVWGVFDSQPPYLTFPGFGDLEASAEYLAVKTNWAERSMIGLLAMATGAVVARSERNA